jgi:hypothetical protein
VPPPTASEITSTEDVGQRRYYCLLRRDAATEISEDRVASVFRPEARDGEVSVAALSLPGPDLGGWIATNVHYRLDISNAGRLFCDFEKVKVKLSP